MQAGFNHGLDPVLAAVSRSFYLTIRVLPPLLRQPIGLAYLLARTTDTVADSTNAPLELRMEALRQMGAALRDGSPMPDVSSFCPGIADPSERKLLEKSKTLWKCLEQNNPEDRADIVWVMGEILQGQEMDLTAFSEVCGGIRSLQTAAELEKYTYSVAGCVGDFWTRVCNRHLSNFAHGSHLEDMAKLGISFGKGLQLVNILRDAPADFANGRCYFPVEELEQIDPAVFLKTPTLARPIYERWIKRAEEHLEDGLRYIYQIHPLRIRLACFLPWALGIKTLQMMGKSLPFETPHRVKVSRKHVRRLLILGILGAFGNDFLKRIAARIKRAS